MFVSVVSINVCGDFIYLYVWVLGDIFFPSFYSCLYGWCAIHNGFMHKMYVHAAQFMNE